MAMLVRRSAFTSVGGFDPSFPLGEDVDLMFRLLESGAGMGTMDRVVVIRRAHANNITRDEEACRRAIFRVLKARIDRQRAAGGQGSR
jgi:GT2 family glycosyltransferase